MRAACLFTLLCAASSAACQQPAAAGTPLHDGQQLTVRGTLATEPAGRLQFVTVKTANVYLPMVPGEGGREQPAAPVREIGLSGFHRYDLLYRHRGQAVTVTGRVMTDGASPYYFHSVSLQAGSIRLADGTELIGTPRSPGRIAVDVGQYSASVVLPADLSAPWQYSAQGAPDPERQFLSCGSNGGGDVVNCSCASGFHAIQAESSVHDATVFRDSGTAQFGVGDDALRVELRVTCSR